LNRPLSRLQSAGIALLLAAAALRGPAQIPAATGPVAASRSGQFLVYGVAPQTPRPYVPDVAANPALVQFEPALAAVSCERIKQALLSTLQAPDQWRGKIYLVLHPPRNAGEDIVVTSSQFADGWSYRIDVPDTVDPARFVRAVTQVLLLEMANRRARDQAASLPAWLAEGLPQLLLDNSEIDLVLRPAGAASGRSLPNRQELRDTRPGDLARQTRQQLHGHAPLTLEELGRLPEDLNGEAGDVFRASARLFLRELLELRNGGAALYATLPELPFDPDWRVAFLRGFATQFPRLIDLEKWWALQSVYAVQHTPDQTWTRAEVLKKLGELLRCPLQVQLGSNEPAFYTDASLQAVIQGWDFRQQSPLLHQKLDVLAALKLRADPDLSGLVEEYRRALQAYLYKMEGGAAASARSELVGHHLPPRPMEVTGVPSPDTPAVQTVIGQLTALDARRAGLVKNGLPNAR
jgi:hypothetical protein